MRILTYLLTAVKGCREAEALLARQETGRPAHAPELRATGPACTFPRNARYSSKAADDSARTPTPPAFWQSRFPRTTTSTSQFGFHRLALQRASELFVVLAHALHARQHLRGDELRFAHVFQVEKPFADAPLHSVKLVRRVRRIPRLLGVKTCRCRFPSPGTSPWRHD